MPRVPRVPRTRRECRRRTLAGRGRGREGSSSARRASDSRTTRPCAPLGETSAERTPPSPTSSESASDGVSRRRRRRLRRRARVRHALALQTPRAKCICTLSSVGVNRSRPETPEPPRVRAFAALEAAPPPHAAESRSAAISSAITSNSLSVALGLPTHAFVGRFRVCTLCALFTFVRAAAPTSVASRRARYEGHRRRACLPRSRFSRLFDPSSASDDRDDKEEHVFCVQLGHEAHLGEVEAFAEELRADDAIPSRRVAIFARDPRRRVAGSSLCNQSARIPPTWSRYPARSSQSALVSAHTHASRAPRVRERAGVSARAGPSGQTPSPSGPTRRTAERPCPTTRGLEGPRSPPRRRAPPSPSRRASRTPERLWNAFPKLVERQRALIERGREPVPPMTQFRLPSIAVRASREAEGRQLATRPPRATTRDGADSHRLLRDGTARRPFASRASPLRNTRSVTEERDGGRSCRARPPSVPE